jgi:TubC N-terminal docking domain
MGRDMSTRVLLEELRERGVELAADGDKLRYRPKAVVTYRLLDQLRAHKQGLLKLLELERRKLEEADRHGLVIKWSEYPEWIELHDPLSGEWHEIRASECLPGVLQSANRHRKKGAG